MPLTITDELLRQAGLSEDEARIEFACRLFEAGRLGLWSAARWCGLPRVQFEAELFRRLIPLYRPTLRDLENELDNLTRLGR